MKRIYLAFACSLIFESCATWKAHMIANGNQDTAIHNAIHAFLHSVKSNKGKRIFYVSVKEINQDLLGVSISETNDKVAIITEDRITFSNRALPTGYLEKDGMLFYWHDSSKKPTDNQDLISTIKKYNILDTLIVGVTIPESTISHGKKGNDYYFCKQNLLKYKKIRTNKAMGYYAPPRMKCP
jgi:hypothetical protein